MVNRKITGILSIMQPPVQMDAKYGGEMTFCTFSRWLITMRNVPSAVILLMEITSEVIAISIGNW